MSSHLAPRHDTSWHTNFPDYVAPLGVAITRHPVLIRPQSASLFSQSRDLLLDRLKCPFHEHVLLLRSLEPTGGHGTSALLPSDREKQNPGSRPGLYSKSPEVPIWFGARCDAASTQRPFLGEEVGYTDCSRPQPVLRRQHASVRTQHRATRNGPLRSGDSSVLAERRQQPRTTTLFHSAATRGVAHSFVRVFTARDDEPSPS